MSGNYVRRQLDLVRDMVLQIRVQKTANVSGSLIDGILDALSRASDGVDGLVARPARCLTCQRLKSSLHRFTEDFNLAVATLNQSVERVEE
jgi:hypothetical protein